MVPVHGQLGALRLVREDGGRGPGPHLEGQRLGDDLGAEVVVGGGGGRLAGLHIVQPGPHGLLVSGERPGQQGERLGDDPGGRVVVGGGDLDLPGDGGPHGEVAGEGPGQLLGPGGAGEATGGVLLLLELSERGAPVELAVLVEGAVPLGVGEVPGGLADGALVASEHGAGHLPGGVLHGVALILELGLPVVETKLADVDIHDDRAWADRDIDIEVVGGET